MRAVSLIGGGQAAAVAARTLRRRGFDGRVDIIGAEAEVPYQRPPLSKEYLATGADDGLHLLTPAWCDANDVHLHLGRRATRVRPDSGSVELADGVQIRADGVILATGSRPRRLHNVSGSRVHYLRTLEDANGLRTQLVAGAHLIVIGAGFIGSEVASTASIRGLRVTMVETLEVPLQHALGPLMGAVYERLHRSHGIIMRLHESVESVTEHPGGVVVTTSGGTIEGDLVVVGIGVEPNVDVAERSGIAVGNGILVDEFCRTSMPNVYAAGDVANHLHPLFGERLRVEHFDNANRQGAAAADNLLGRTAPYDNPHWFWSEQYDTNLQYVGHATRWDDLVIRGHTDELEFCAFYLRDGLIQAAFAMDRGTDIAIAKELIADRVHVDAQVLADEDIDLAELTSLEAEL